MAHARKPVRTYHYLPLKLDASYVSECFNFKLQSQINGSSGLSQSFEATEAERLSA